MSPSDITKISAAYRLSTQRMLNELTYKVRDACGLATITVDFCAADFCVEVTV